MKEFFEKLFANTPLTVLILGAVFILLGAMGGIPLNTPIQTVDNPGRIALFVVGAICLIAALPLSLSTSILGKIPIRNSYGITLESPASANSEVAIQVEGERPQLSGKYRKKPPEGMLRLFVYDENSKRYWPQGKRHIIWQEGKRWSGSVRLGGVGYMQTVIVALVPPSGQALCDYYEEVGEATTWHHFNGTLPADMVIIGKVNMSRFK